MIRNYSFVLLELVTGYSLNHGRKNKLEPYYNGPYLVKELELPNVVIKYDDKFKKVQINNLKLI